MFAGALKAIAVVLVAAGCGERVRPGAASCERPAVEFPPYRAAGAGACRDVIDPARESVPDCSATPWGLAIAQTASDHGFGRLWLDQDPDQSAFRLLFASVPKAPMSCDLPVQVASVPGELPLRPAIGWGQSAFDIAWCQGGTLRLARLAGDGTPRGSASTSVACLEGLRLQSLDGYVVVHGRALVGPDTKVFVLRRDGGLAAQFSVPMQMAVVAHDGVLATLAADEAEGIRFEERELDGSLRGTPVRLAMPPFPGGVPLGPSLAWADGELWSAWWTTTDRRAYLARLAPDGAIRLPATAIEGLSGTRYPSLAVRSGRGALLWMDSGARPEEQLCAESLRAALIDASGRLVRDPITVGAAALNDDHEVIAGPDGFSIAITATLLVREAFGDRATFCPRPYAIALDQDGNPGIAWRLSPGASFRFRPLPAPSGQAGAGGAGRGGSDGGAGTAGRGTWTPTSSSGAPMRRRRPAAVWTGSAILLWGGESNQSLGDGARYVPRDDRWTPLPTTSAPAPAAAPVAVWSGTEMLVFGGDAVRSGRYSEVGGWRPVSSAGAPTSEGARMVWTGSEAIVWGGRPGAQARYAPASDRWQPVSTVAAPAVRDGATLVWTGSEAIAWGGADARGASQSSGAAYEPVGDRWRALPDQGAPSPRYEHAAVWTGSEMVVFGGTDDQGAPNSHVLASGAAYAPTTGAWRQLPEAGAPTGRQYHGLVMVGGSVVVWGGWDGALTPLGDGAVLDLLTHVWSPITGTGQPEARGWHAAISIGNGMFIWGGVGDAGPLESGALWRP